MARRRQCWYLTRLLMLSGLMALCILPAQQASGHANLLRAVPEPNTGLQQPLERVTLWFSERIAPDFSAIQVFDAQGRQVDNDDSAVAQEEETVLTVTLQRIPHGLYTVVIGSLTVWSLARERTTSSHAAMGSTSWLPIAWPIRFL